MFYWLVFCQTWTPIADSERRIRAFKTKCLRKLLSISHLEHETNDHYVRSKINFSMGPQEPPLASVKRRKLARFGHVTHHDSLSKTTLLQGTFEGERRRSRQRKCWMDNIKEWTALPTPELLTMASCREGWKRLSESSLMSPRRPNRLRD